MFRPSEEKARSTSINEAKTRKWGTVPQPETGRNPCSFSDDLFLPLRSSLCLRHAHYVCTRRSPLLREKMRTHSSLLRPTSDSNSSSWQHDNRSPRTDIGTESSTDVESQTTARERPYRRGDPIPPYDEFLQSSSGFTREQIRFSYGGARHCGISYRRVLSRTMWGEVRAEVPNRIYLWGGLFQGDRRDCHITHTLLPL